MAGIAQSETVNAIFDGKAIASSEILSGIPKASMTSDVSGHFGEYKLLQDLKVLELDELKAVFNSNPFYGKAAKKYANILSKTEATSPGITAIHGQLRLKYGTGINAINGIAAEMQAAASARQFVDLVNDPETAGTVPVNPLSNTTSGFRKNVLLNA